MNHTWIGIAHADKPGIQQFDYNKFLLTSDLFLNGTLSDVSDDINIIYPPFFSSSTITSLLARNNSNRSSAIRNNDTNGISTSIGKVILTFLISTMAFLTVSGNSLVIIAFICEPTIRTYSNYFILNLSIADLLIGLIWYVRFSSVESARARASYEHLVY